jgi:hypothetical protein
MMAYKEIGKPIGRVRSGNKRRPDDANTSLPAGVGVPAVLDGAGHDAASQIAKNSRKRRDTRAPAAAARE